MTFFERLSQYRNFVVWRYEYNEAGTLTKVPYNPTTGKRASSIDPNTWVDFKTACDGVGTTYNGIGFMLSKEAGLTVVEGDNPFVEKSGGMVRQITELDGDEFNQAQQIHASYPKIIQRFDSYAEMSPSGMGFHIWIEGQLPEDCGNRVSTIEVYSHSRFFTLTGVHIDWTPQAIHNRQGVLDVFVKDLGLDGKTRAANVNDGVQYVEDEGVISTIRGSKIGAAYDKLAGGDASGYPSESEADQALANYIGHFAGDMAQAERIFRVTAYFAKRGKLNGPRADYLIGRLIRNSFDRKPPAVTAENLRKQIEAIACARQPDATKTDDASEPAETGEVQPELDTSPLGATDEVVRERPAGLLGDIADFIYASAPRPMAEAAIAGAVGLMAGICGRAWNVYGTGLNHFVVMVGEPGVGKEAISSGISRLMNEVSKRMSSAAHFVGPSNIQSAPALYKLFAAGTDGPGIGSCVSMMPEFGHTLKVLTDERASSNTIMLRGAILDMYNKSGRGQFAGGFKYSDGAKDMPRVKSPAWSFVGDTVPDSFYEACTSGAINSGLVARLNIVEYRGKRPPLNKYTAGVKPTDDLVAKMIGLCEMAHAMNQANMPLEVEMTVEAENALDAWNNEIDRTWNAATDNKTVRHVWNRAHIKAAKLAALRAIGRNWQAPRIDISDVEWGIRFVRNDIACLIGRFDIGEISGGRKADDRERAALKILKKYVERGKPYNSPLLTPEMYQQGLIPHAIIKQHARMYPAFKEQPGRDSSQQLLDTMKHLASSGIVEQLLPNSDWLKACGKTGSTALIYRINVSEMLHEARNAGVE